MMASNAPGEFYEKLGEAEKRVVDDWTQRRAMLLQSMVSKSISDSLKDDACEERSSKPYVRLLVKVFHPSTRCSTTKLPKKRATGPQLAELTIWCVLDDQFDLVKEGAVVRMKNVVAKSVSREGTLQLSANQETPMEALSYEPTDEQLIQSGYVPRSPCSFIHINVMARKIGQQDRLANEIDVAACVVKIQKVGDNTTILYLTDESGLVLKIRRDHNAQIIDPFSLGNTCSLPLAVAFSNVQVTSFDAVDNCAVATWGLTSCKTHRLMQSRCEELQSWCSSLQGATQCNAILDQIVLGIPRFADQTSKKTICFGYIMSLENKTDDGSSNVNAAIDYGGETTVEATFPTHLLPHAIQLCQNNSEIEVSVSASALEQINLHILNEYFQTNQTLLRFTLDVVSCYGGELPMLEVSSVSPVNIDALARLRLTSVHTSDE